MELKVNYTYKARVRKVVDGDTVDVEIDLGFHLHTTQRLRLARIDTPELRSPIPEERAKAVKAMNYLELKVLEKEILVTTKKSDLYGRYIAEIVIDGVNINDLMLENGMAKKYGS